MKNFVLIFFVLFSFTVQGAKRPKAVDLEPSPDPLQKIKRLKIKNISDLSRLAPFRDVAVIQRRYLPKTFRGELGLSLNGLLNNKFFYSGGFSGELGFFVRERFGFGASGMAFWRMQRVVSRNLRATTGISAFTNAQSHYYGGGYFKWNPVYGKFAFSFLKDRIVYFDMFFLLGGGMIYLTRGVDPSLKRVLESEIDPEKLNVNEDVRYAPIKEWWPALMLGFGQTFAVNKSLGIVWNLRWIIYRFKTRHEQNDKEETNENTDIHLSIGVNYYFPGVKYR